MRARESAIFASPVVLLALICLVVVAIHSGWVGNDAYMVKILIGLSFGFTCSLVFSIKRLVDRGGAKKSQR